MVNRITNLIVLCLIFTIVLVFQVQDVSAADLQILPDRDKSVDVDLDEVHPNGYFEDNLHYFGHNQFEFQQTTVLGYPLGGIVRPIESVELKLYIETKLDAGSNHFINFYGSDDNNWLENNQDIPTEYANLGLLGHGLFATGEYTTLDVTEFVKSQLTNGYATFVLEGPTADQYDGTSDFVFNINDRLSGVGEQFISQLIVTYKPQYTVTFKDYDGTNLKTETVDHGSGATAPVNPTRTNYTFTGWDTVFTNVISDLTVTAEYTIDTYTVTFKDHDGTELKIETVDHGSGATAPPDPTRTGHRFTGWDTVFTNVTSDLTVTAEYIQTYTVTFKDYDGTDLKTETVDHGSGATAPVNPTRTNYRFTGWDTVFTNVTSDLTVTAEYIQTYTVTFKDYDGAELKTETVDHGSGATAPANPTRTGHAFTGWDTIFTNVTSDLTVTAEYTVDTYTVTFKDHDGTELKIVTVDHGSGATAPVNPTRTNYTFTGWDTVFTNVISDLTVTAEYTIDTYTVTFKDYDGAELKTETVDHGSGATAPPDPTRTGHRFTGWDTVFTNVTSDLTVTAEYIQTYTVTFKDYDGTDLKTETVDHGSGATAPVNPTRTNYRFTGWDTVFTNVTSDLTVTAEYIQTYTVTFKDYDGTDLKTETVDHGSGATAPANPTRTGHTFIDWDTIFTNVTSDLTVTAEYIQTYTVTFKDYDGAELKTETVDHGSGATAPANPTRTGHTFIDWDTIFTNVTSDLTITAEYEIDQYIVSFDVDGGSAVSNQTINHGSAVIEPVTAPTKTGYTFAGWYTDSTYETSFDFATAITENTVIYTKFVSDNANLSDLVVVPDVITPDFSPDEVDYSMTVEHGISEIRITTQTEENHAILEINGKLVVSGDEEIIPIKYGLNVVEIIVTAQDSSEKMYTVSIHRSNPPGPRVEIIEIDLVAGNNQQSTVRITIERSRDGSGNVIDKVILKPSDTLESVKNAEEAGEKVIRIIIPDNTEVSEVNFELKKESLSTLADGKHQLQLSMKYLQLMLLEETLQSLGEDIYFRIVPLRQEDQKEQTSERLKQLKEFKDLVGDQYTIVGDSLTIETNMSDREVKMRLPINTEIIPDGINEGEFLNSLAVYIEHSDGEKVLQRGNIVIDENGSTMLEVTIYKFSTFTVLSVEGQESNVKLPYVNGYSDGSFRPNQSINRAEMASLLARVMDLEASTQQFSYTDVSASHWGLDNIDKVHSKGLMKANEQGNFRPSDSVTRAEMAAIISRWLGLEVTEDGTPFTDVSSNHWAFLAIEQVKQAGIMNGYNDGTFKPSNALTRAEAVTIINRIIGLEPVGNLDASSFSDVSIKHWALGDIEAAASNKE